MKENESLSMSFRLKEMLKTDLSHTFTGCLPVDLIEEKAKSEKSISRDRIFTPVNTVLIMLLSAVQEDKSMQNALNMFKSVFEGNCKILRQAEKLRLQEEKNHDSQQPVKRGRPKKYEPRLPKRFLKPLCDNTAGYATARKNLDKDIIETVYNHSTEFGDLDKESWHGMKTYISDGTYLQLQDTEDIQSEYAATQESTYPQALLQVLIRQGSGQVCQMALSKRQVSELLLIIPMIKKLEANSLLLADDLYNTYYHFSLTLAQKCHIIVPGKRDRNYKVMSTINENDQIVEIAKTTRPDYVTQEEWNTIPKTLLLRRITYTYPTKNGVESAVLYTTLLDENIKTSDIITKYTMRWDIEISIRETKTIMDINVLRSKSRDMMIKELLIALTAYNMVRKKLAESADIVGFSPQDDIFQKYFPVNRTILLDKKGRILFKRSPGRFGFPAKDANQQTPDSASKRKEATLSKKNKARKISKI